MNMKDELAEMKSNLAELKERIENDDAEAIEQGQKLMDEISKKEAEIKAADEKEALLKSIGKEPENMGEQKTGLAAMDLASLKNERGSVSTYIKAATDAHTSAVVGVTDQNVLDVEAPLNVRSLFGAESINGNALTYYILNAMEGTPGKVAEGAKKPQIHIPYEAKTVSLIKQAAYFKDTDEILSDTAFLESAIRNRGIFEFNKVVEKYLVDTLLATDGVQALETGITFDSLLTARQNILSATGYVPDAIVINPADLVTLMTLKDKSGQYLLAGPGYGAYGNGAAGANPAPSIWGMKVVESAAAAKGTLLVGAYKAGASVITKAGEGLRVEVTNTNEDDFIYNRVTVRIEERLVEAVRVPAAFAKITATA